MSKKKVQTTLLSIVMCSSCILATIFSTIAWFEVKRQQDIANDNYIQVVSYNSKIKSFEAFKFEYSKLYDDEDTVGTVYDYDNPSSGKVVLFTEEEIENEDLNKRPIMNIYDPAYLIIHEDETLRDLNTNIVYKVTLETNIPNSISSVITMIKKDMERESGKLYISRYIDIQVFSQTEVQDCINNYDPTLSEDNNFYPSFYSQTEADNKTTYDPEYYAVSYLASIEDNYNNRKHLYTGEDSYDTAETQVTVRSDSNATLNENGIFTYYINVNYATTELSEFAFETNESRLVYYDCYFNIKVGEPTTNTNEN